MTGALYAMGSPSATPSAPTSPQFSDVINRVNQPITAGNANYQNAINTLQPTASSPISPGTQAILDKIQQQGNIYKGTAQADASSYAISRGIGGSSTDLLGRIQAGILADQSTLGAQTNTMLQGQQYQQNALGQISQLYGQQGLGQNQAQMQGNLMGGQLTSDEIASLRNMGLSQQYLQMQQQLGNQANQLGYANINSAQQIAQQQARNSLLGSGATLLAPYLFGGGGGGMGGMGGGAGVFGNFAGNVATAFGGGGGGATAMGGMPGMGTLGANPLSLYGSGAAGGVGGAGAGGLQLGGGMGFGANLGLGGAGMLAGQQAFGNNLYSNIGGVAGGVGGSLFGPVGSGIGAFAGEGIGNQYGKLNDTAKALVNPFVNPGATVKAVTSGVNKTLGIGAGKTANGNLIADNARQVQSDTDQLKQASKDLAAGNITQDQFNTQMNSLLSDSKHITESVAGMGSTYASAINPFWQSLQTQGYVKAQNGKWVDSAGNVVA